MSLPILKVVSAPTEQTLVRYFHQTQSNWSAHMAESSPLDFGTAWVNPELNRVQIANRMMDVALPPEITPAQAMQIADEYFSSRNSNCLEWVMNPSAPPEQTGPMIAQLQSSGFQPFATNIMYLERLPASLPGTVDPTLKVIPARASFRHARELHEQDVTDPDRLQRIEARMLHLDDPHFDALLALQDGHAVGLVGVLAMGEIGLIAQLRVVESHRRRGIGTMLMGRALEICARSLFKHVLLDVWTSDAHVAHLYEKFGFRTIGQFVVYQRPMDSKEK